MLNDALCLEADLSDLHERFAGICRRNAKRFHFDLGAMGQLAFPGDVSSQEIWLLDISETGIAFWSDWPLDSGMEMVMKLMSRSGETVTLQARVIYAIRQRGGWRMGCQFTVPFTPEMIEELL